MLFHQFMASRRHTIFVELGNIIEATGANVRVKLVFEVELCFGRVE